MSAERCLNIIDGLLNILDEADKREGGGGAGAHTHTSGKTCSDSSHTHSHDNTKNTSSSSSTTTTKSAQSTEPSKPFVYFQSLDEIEESQLVQITSDFAVLRTKWKEAGLVDNDEVIAFCNQIGKVTEIETSDDTLQIQWENYDTCWVPAFACGRAPSGAKLTIPGTNNSWLDESKAIGAEYAEELKREAEENQNAQEDGPLLANAEDPAVKEGKALRVTRDLAILEEKWKSCELGPHDNLSQYLGAVGVIESIAEDDDTVELRWENYETAWLPVQACMDAKDAKPTLPGPSDKSE